MEWFLISWVAGSCVVAIAMILLTGLKVDLRAALLCVATTFTLLFIIEQYATYAGIWSWNPDVSLIMIGRVPLEEMMLYITSPTLTILFFEGFRWLLPPQRKDCS
ncbi:hypothetical protein QA601_14585 [Chitinispirillales bacterium ANBcel5]|uniref:hypothetical protein n=1 Tax=Cellulosispirillum alkaliphilum TaxID=3039283 RepID=UPI002A5268C5|nr:hypothetical protein [Chitinispirillales bacterium ANBcel5]